MTIPNPVVHTMPPDGEPIYHAHSEGPNLEDVQDQLQELRKELRENGSSMEVTGDRAIITKKNPAGDLLLRLGPQIKAMLNEFKMTPNSRGKTFAGVGETDKTAGDGFDEV